MRLYDNSRTVHDEAAILTDFQQRSSRVAAQFPAQHLSYGPHPRHSMSLFNCGHSHAPLLVFVHGGYWQWCDKEDFLFVVPPMLSQGLDVVMLEYPLTPTVSFAEVVASVGMALDALAKRPEHQARSVILCGHSAGGHLAAQWQHHPWVTQVCAISGLFDLQPLQATHLNEALRLSADDITAFSPVLHAPSPKPTLIVCGEQELSELQSQSAQYFHTIQPDNPHAHLQFMADCNHYNILDALFAQPRWWSSLTLA